VLATVSMAASAAGNEATRPPAKVTLSSAQQVMRIAYGHGEGHAGIVIVTRRATATEYPAEGRDPGARKVSTTPVVSFT